MKRDLRRIHFLSILALAAGIAIALPAALLNQPQPPVASSMTGGRDAVPGRPLLLPANSAESFPARVEVWRNGSLFQLRLSPRLRFSGASVLVYWSSRGESGERELPASAWLLGEWSSLDGSPLQFPPGASAEPGTLWLWSLAHRQVLGRIDLPPLQSLDLAEAQ